MQRQIQGRGWGGSAPPLSAAFVYLLFMKRLDKIVLYIAVFTNWLIVTRKRVHLCITYFCLSAWRLDKNFFRYAESLQGKQSLLEACHLQLGQKLLMCIFALLLWIPGTTPVTDSAMSSGCVPDIYPTHMWLLIFSFDYIDNRCIFISVEGEWVRIYIMNERDQAIAESLSCKKMSLNFVCTLFIWTIVALFVIDNCFKR